MRWTQGDCALEPVQIPWAAIRNNLNAPIRQVFDPPSDPKACRQPIDEVPESDALDPTGNQKPERHFGRGHHARMTWIPIGTREAAMITMTTTVKFSRTTLRFPK